MSNSNILDVYLFFDLFLIQHNSKLICDTICNTKLKRKQKCYL